MVAAKFGSSNNASKMRGQTHLLRRLQAESVAEYIAKINARMSPFGYNR